MLEVDQIYHLACPASPVHYQYNPVKTIKTNVLGTLNMLGLAKRVKARILLASTSEIYGDPQVHPQTEEYWGNVNPIGIRSCYDEGKRVAETLMMDYHRQNRVDIRIARIFNTYGPRMAMNDGRVVSNFIVQALTGQEITIYGEGQQTRSFCYVSDLVDGLVRLMNCDGRIRTGEPGQSRRSSPSWRWPERSWRLIDTPAAMRPPGPAAGRPGPAPPGHHPGPGAAGLAAHRAFGSRTEGDHPLFCGKLKQENIAVAASLTFRSSDADGVLTRSMANIICSGRRRHPPTPSHGRKPRTERTLPRLRTAREPLPGGVGRRRARDCRQRPGPSACGISTPHRTMGSASPSGASGRRSPSGRPTPT